MARSYGRHAHLCINFVRFVSHYQQILRWIKLNNGQRPCAHQLFGACNVCIFGSFHRPRVCDICIHPSAGRKRQAIAQSTVNRLKVSRIFSFWAELNCASKHQTRLGCIADRNWRTGGWAGSVFFDVDWLQIVWKLIKKREIADLIVNRFRVKIRKFIWRKSEKKV